MTANNTNITAYAWVEGVLLVTFVIIRTIRVWKEPSK